MDGLVRSPPEERIGERFLSKRSPPWRYGWLFVGGLLAALIGVIILFAVGQWQPGVIGIAVFVALLVWARKTSLP